MVLVLDFSRNGHHQLWSDFAVSWLDRKDIAYRQVFIGEEFLAECSRAGKIGGPVLFWQKLDAILRLKSDDLCVFMYWDYAAAFWLPFQQRAMLFPAKVMGIWMNAWGARPRFLTDKSLNLCVLDEHLCATISTIANAQINWIPDFTSTAIVDDPFSHPLLEEIRNFKADRKLLLLIGAINGSKNMGLLHKLIDSWDTPDWVIAIVGESFLPAESMEAILSKTSIVRQWSGRVTDDRLYNAILQEAHLLWGVYWNWKGSSNLITKAGMFSIPIVVSRGFLMQERVEKYALGFAVDQDNPAGLHALLHNWEDLFPRYMQDNGAKKQLFKQMFSAENAAAIFIKVVTESQRRPLPRGNRTAAKALLQLRRTAQTFINLIKYLLRK